MKKFIRILIILFSFLSFSNSYPTNQNKQKKILAIVLSILQKSHFNPIKIDDTFSKNVFKEYIFLLDKQKLFFLDSDINEFKKFETKIDDQILKNDLTFFYLTHDRMIKRMKEAKKIYIDLNKGRIDINTNEIINTDFENCNYPKTEDEIRKKWLALYKYSILTLICDDKKKEIYNNLGLEEQEKKAREETFIELNSSGNNFEYFNKSYFFDLYINAIINQFDNHSQYFSSDNKNKLEQEISGKIVGIGVKLENKNEFIAVNQIAYGGPAWKSKKIEVGDVFLKIQDENKEAVDVVGYNQQDFIKLTRGKIGSLIKVTVKKPDGTIKTVSLKRAVIEINDSYVKSAVVTNKNIKYGIIDIPIFYEDFDDEAARDAAKDVENEIENLKKENIEGIIIDLRNNPGGSLAKAMQIAGYFLGKNPIVQVKNADKSVQVLSSDVPQTLWDRPLVLITNKNSASASEVFAAAIQDYKRGIIIGCDQTFGKGTTQNIVNLNDYNPKKDEDDLGILKTTIQKYYRVDGNSTQLKGVKSDINAIERFSKIEVGEKTKKNILPWDKIKPINFSVVDKILNYSEVVNASNFRVANNANLKIENELLEYNFKNIEKTMLIDLEKYRIKKKVFNDEISRLTNSFDFTGFLEFKSTEAENSLFKKLPSLEEKRKQWHEKLAKDIYVDEAINILSMIKLK
jgi:carboxyl-terminal processing protease